MTDKLKHIPEIEKIVDDLDTQKFLTFLTSFQSSVKAAWAMTRSGLTVQDLALLSNEEIKKRGKREWSGLGDKGIKISENALELYLIALGRLHPKPRLSSSRRQS